MNYRLLYFARLGEQAGVADETLESDRTDARGLYADLCQKHGFALPIDSLRIAVNGVFVEWSQPLDDGDEIAFIPPVSGG